MGIVIMVDDFKGYFYDVDGSWVILRQGNVVHHFGTPRYVDLEPYVMPQFYDARKI